MPRLIIFRDLDLVSQCFCREVCMKCRVISILKSLRRLVVVLFDPRFVLCFVIGVLIYTQLSTVVYIFIMFTIFGRSYALFLPDLLISVLPSFYANIATYWRYISS